jgi:hypothetical protein
MGLRCVAQSGVLTAQKELGLSRSVAGVAGGVVSFGRGKQILRQSVGHEKSR